MCPLLQWKIEDKQCTYKVTMRCGFVSIVAVENTRLCTYKVTMRCGFVSIVAVENRQVLFLISKHRRFLNVVFSLLGDSPASEFYVPTFRNCLVSGWNREFRNVGV